MGGTCCFLLLLLLSFGASAQAPQPFTALSNNADTANDKLFVEVMYEQPGCGDYMAMFTLVDRAGVSTPLEIDSVLNNAGTYQLSSDRRALMRPQAGGYRLRFTLLDDASVRDSFRILISSHKLAYRCVGCGAAGSDAIFEPKHVKAGCPPLSGEVLACHQRTGRMANWEAWVQDPRGCAPYRVVMLPDGKWWFAQNLRWDGLGQAAADGSGSRLYTWYEAVTGREVPAGVQPLLTINSDEVGPQGVCPEGWHVPTQQEWHALGVSMGSGAATLSDPWNPHALYHLVSFNYYGATGLREGNDESGFTWLPTPFVGVRGIARGEVLHGALWSAGSAGDAADSYTISRVAAQATATAWANSPLTADGRMGDRNRDRLPLRCAYGEGVAPTVEGAVPLPPDTDCGLSHGTIAGTPLLPCGLGFGSVDGPPCGLGYGGVAGAVPIPCSMSFGTLGGAAAGTPGEPCGLTFGDVSGPYCGLGFGAIGAAAAGAPGEDCALSFGTLGGAAVGTPGEPCGLSYGGIWGSTWGDAPGCGMAFGGISGPPCGLGFGSIGAAAAGAPGEACGLSFGTLGGAAVGTPGEPCGLSYGALAGAATPGCGLNAGAIISGTLTPTAGAACTLSSAAAATAAAGTVTYRWYRSGALIAGATGESYTVPAAEASGEAVEFRRLAVVSGGCGGAREGYSNAVTVSFGTACGLDAGAIALDGTPLPGQAYTISSASPATASVAVSYRWYRNDVLIAGATGESYTVPAAQASGTFRRQASVTGCLGVTEVYSNAVTVDFEAGASTVTVAGIVWASANVDMFGASINSKADQYTAFYQWGSSTGWSATYPGAGEAVYGWSATDNSAGVATWPAAGNPCPTGWRLPTLAEFQALFSSGSYWEANTNTVRRNAVPGYFVGPNHATCAYPDQMVGCIFFPASGLRGYANGALSQQGAEAWCWTSERLPLLEARAIRLGNNGAAYIMPTSGANVRCVRPKE